MRIGTYSDSTPSRTRYVSDDAELRPHLKKPWLEDWLERDAKEYGDAEEDHIFPQGGQANIDESDLSKHALIVGKSGFGKTRFATHLALEQLRNGCSLVFLDPLAPTVLDVLAHFQKEPIPRDRIIAAIPSLTGPFAWNPIDAKGLGVSADIAAKAFLDVVRESQGLDHGTARMVDLLSNALILASTHGLSLFEVIEMLCNRPYLESILRRDMPPNIVNAQTYTVVKQYFTREFPTFAKAGNLEAVSPAINKIRETIRSPFLHGMFCSLQNTFDLRSLWSEPRVLLLNLDEDELGEEAARLLGGLFLTHLMAAAKRMAGKGRNPVVLFLDEIAFTQQYLGKSAGKMFGMARKLDLRVIAACQYLNKINSDLRGDLLSVSTQAFFRLEPNDADLVAGLATNSGRSPNTGTPKTVRLTVASRRGGVVESELARWTVVNVDGEAVSLSPLQFDALQSLPKGQQTSSLERLMSFDQLHEPLACVEMANHRYEIASLLQGLPDGVWQFTGPQPVQLIVSFPRPKALIRQSEGNGDRARAWKHTLMNQATGEMLLFSAGESIPREVKAIKVPDAGAAQIAVGEQNKWELTDEYIQECMVSRQATVEIESEILPTENMPAKVNDQEAKPIIQTAAQKKSTATKPAKPLPEAAMPEEGWNSDDSKL